MRDLYLCFFGLLTVFTYFIYMYLGPGGDGAIFGSVMAMLGLFAGIKVKEKVFGY